MQVALDNICSIASREVTRPVRKAHYVRRGKLSYLHETGDLPPIARLRVRARLAGLVVFESAAERQSKLLRSNNGRSSSSSL